MTRSPLENGLYEVNYKGISAGFVVEKGRVTRCAPILRKKMAFWETIAVRIAD